MNKPGKPAKPGDTEPLPGTSVVYLRVLWNDVEPKDVAAYEDGLYEYLQARYEDLLVRIEQGQWEASDVETLKEALKGYKR